MRKGPKQTFMANAFSGNELHLTENDVKPFRLRQMDLEKGEWVEWSIDDRGTLVLQRPDAPPSPLGENEGLSSKLLVVFRAQSRAASCAAARLKGAAWHVA